MHQVHELTRILFDSWFQFRSPVYGSAKDGWSTRPPPLGDSAKSSGNHHGTSMFCSRSALQPRYVTYVVRRTPNRTIKNPRIIMRSSPSSDSYNVGTLLLKLPLKSVYYPCFDIQSSRRPLPSRERVILVPVKTRCVGWECTDALCRYRPFTMPQQLRTRTFRSRSDREHCSRVFEGAHILNPQSNALAPGSRQTSAVGHPAQH